MQQKPQTMEQLQEYVMQLEASNMQLQQVINRLSTKNGDLQANLTYKEVLLDEANQYIVQLTKQPQPQPTEVE